MATSPERPRFRSPQLESAGLKSPAMDSIEAMMRRIGVAARAQSPVRDEAPAPPARASPPRGASASDSSSSSEEEEDPTAVPMRKASPPAEPEPEPEQQREPQQPRRNLSSELSRAEETEAQQRVAAATVQQ